MLDDWLAAVETLSRVGISERVRERLGVGSHSECRGVVFEQIHQHMNTHKLREPGKESLFSCRSFVSQ